MNKTFQIFEVLRTKWDTYRLLGITQVNSGEQLRRQSASEGRRNGSCRTETLAMRRVRFGLFPSR